MQDKSPLDLIWDAIQIQYAAIIRSQQIMYVTDKNDKTIEKSVRRTEMLSVRNGKSSRHGINRQGS